MGKYYCDYCDIYLTHDSMNARKAHNSGRNHVANVRDYFANLGTDRTQHMIDHIANTHEGGGRAQMFAAPSMRLGAGFMNPVATAPGGYPPFQGGPGPPQRGGPPGGPPGGPSFQARLPFPPQGGAPPFPPPGGAPPFPPPGGAMPPFPPRGGPPPQQGRAPPPHFTQQQGPPPAGNPGVHPDRMRHMNH